MRRAAFTIIDEDRVSEVDAVLSQDTAWLSLHSLETALGWRHHPQGLCKGELCIPISDEMDVVSDEGVDLVAFAELLTRPLALDLEERIALLGTSVAERTARLESLEAPEFTLPDLGGRLHSLSEQRGKKVLLVAYASW